MLLLNGDEWYACMWPRFYTYLIPNRKRLIRNITHPHSVGRAKSKSIPPLSCVANPRAYLVLPTGLPKRDRKPPPGLLPPLSWSVRNGNKISRDWRNPHYLVYTRADQGCCHVMYSRLEHCMIVSNSELREVILTTLDGETWIGNNLQ
jgi:hypothetical protein